MTYSTQDTPVKKKKKSRVITVFGTPADPDDALGDHDSRKKNKGLTLLGPKLYTAPFINVVQPLKAMSTAASSATAARINRGGGGGGVGGVGVGVGGGGRRVSGEEYRPIPIPVVLGVNAEEGVMFVHGAFPVTMPKVRNTWLVVSDWARLRV